jgi:hypothetical protein
MRLRGTRRSGRRDQHSQGGTRPVRLRSERCPQVASSRNPPKRARSGSMLCLSSVGIPRLRAGRMSTHPLTLTQPVYKGPSTPSTQR